MFLFAPGFADLGLRDYRLKRLYFNGAKNNGDIVQRQQDSRQLQGNVVQKYNIVQNNVKIK